MTEPTNKYAHLIDELNIIGISLSAEKDYRKLLGKILDSAMRITHADGATIYLVKDEKKLSFTVFKNKSLGLEFNHVDYPEEATIEIMLYNKNGEPNLSNICSYSYHKNSTLNIDDAYENKQFDFTGMRESDTGLHYRSQSFIAIPMRNHEDKTIGILQLINAKDDATGKVIPFSEEITKIAESVASQAAIVITQNALIQQHKHLFESLIKLIAKAIDEKSKYTSNHCSRVPVITQMIAEAANHAKSGPFKEFNLSETELEELRIAAWLHDCGKISIPDYVVDKRTKLESLYDRIEVINLKFEILKRDVLIELISQKLSLTETREIIIETANICNKLEFDRLFLNRVNIGGEYLTKDQKEKILNLANLNININNIEIPLLSDQEVSNLCVERGTLNETERKTIQRHVEVTQKMLALLPYPDYLKNVALIAGQHHERVDGKGYPGGLTKEQMPIQSRMLAIADIFEALTAADRPYKDAKSLTETIAIMRKMRDEGHIDADLFDLFIEEKIPEQYAKIYLL